MKALLYKSVVDNKLNFLIMIVWAILSSLINLASLSFIIIFSFNPLKDRYQLFTFKRSQLLLSPLVINFCRFILMVGVYFLSFLLFSYTPFMPYLPVTIYEVIEVLTNFLFLTVILLIMDTLFFIKSYVVEIPLYLFLLSAFIFLNGKINTTYTYPLQIISYTALCIFIFMSIYYLTYWFKLKEITYVANK